MDEANSINYKSNKNIVYYIIFAAILIRFLAVLLTCNFHKEGIVFVNDSYGYEKLALSFLKYGQAALSPSSIHPYIPWTSGYPIIKAACDSNITWPPGYAVFIATVFSLFGQNYLIINLLQVIMTIIIFLLIIDISIKIFDTDSVIIVSLLMALDTLFIRSSQFLLTETLFTFFLVLISWIAVNGLTSNKWSYISCLLFGLCLSLATMVRPIAYYLIIPIIFCCLYQFRMLLYSWKKSFALIIILLIPWVTIIGGWKIRNYVMTGISDFTTNQAFNLFYSTGASILAAKEKIPIEQAQEKLVLLIPTNISPNDLVRLHTKIGLDLIKENPVTMVKIVLKNIIIILFGPGYAQFNNWLPNKLMAYTATALAMVVLFLAYLGILLFVVNIKKNLISFLLGNITVWCIASYLLFVSACGPSSGRFRIPLMPFIILLGGNGLEIAYRRYVKGKLIS